MKKRVVITGGLGNQMFEYAFFLSLKARGIDCALDLSRYGVDKMHNGYELDRVFGIKAPIVANGLFNRLVSRVIFKFRPKQIALSPVSHEYDEAVFTKHVWYYIGVWMNELFFPKNEEDVRKAFQFKDIDERNDEVAKEVAQCNSVSLHIRRGDYLNLPNYSVCDEQFYRKAVDYILGKVKNPKFYVFSNDLEWSRDFMEGFNVDYEIITHNQGNDSYKDMYLMSKCKHNIIANSTFSWWGAWLNTNATKIVVSPSKWFRNRDYVPEFQSSEFHHIEVC